MVKSSLYKSIRQLIKKEMIEYHHFATSNELMEIGIKHQWMLILEKRKKEGEVTK